MKTCSEKALEWNVTPRTVNAMCKNGRIQGAVKEKRTYTFYISVFVSGVHGH